MRYYLDTAVWVALIDAKHPAHATARKAFEKASKGTIIVSFSHIKEMRELGMEAEYWHAAKRLPCAGVKTP